MSKALRNLSLDAFEAAIGWKLMYHVCGEPRQFWSWCDELELAFVLAERARVEEAGVALLPERAASNTRKKNTQNTYVASLLGWDGLEEE